MVLVKPRIQIIQKGMNLGKLISRKGGWTNARQGHEEVWTPIKMIGRGEEQRELGGNIE